MALPYHPATPTLPGRRLIVTESLRFHARSATILLELDREITPGGS